MAGVYISYPFCAQKCSYCNFASGVFSKDLEARYRDRLLEEVAQNNWLWTPNTVYLGGGTPSLWPLDDLKRLLSQIPGWPWVEATMEAAPGSLTSDRVAAWRKIGINRVSLGVQSFVDGEIRRSGRKHTAAIVRSDVALLRNEGIEEINVDLIAGLSEQNSASWDRSLEETLELNVPHVSVYILEVDDESRLGKEVLLNGQRYGAREIPSDDDQAEFYQRAADRLALAGIFRYEISNFARPGHESRHNLKYWRLEPYLGFGADAHSYDGAWRWQNSEDITAYLEANEIERQRPDVDGEKYWVGLRLSEGVVRTGEHRSKIDRLIDDGLLEQEHDRVRLTPKGVLLSNEVFQEFVSDALD